MLDRLSFANTSVRQSALHQGRIVLFNYWLVYCLLKSGKPAFQELEAPFEDAPQPEEASAAAGAATQPAAATGGGAAVKKA